MIKIAMKSAAFSYSSLLNVVQNDPYLQSMFRQASGVQQSKECVY